MKHKYITYLIIAGCYIGFTNLAFSMESQQGSLNCVLIDCSDTINDQHNYVELKNDKIVPSNFYAVTWFSIQSLFTNPKTDDYKEAIGELVEKCRNPQYSFSTKGKNILRNGDLIDLEGNVLEAMQNLILSSAKGKFPNIVWEDPKKISPKNLMKM